ncbi:recombinase family protein [Actinomadura gamaensis]|uniref:Recombinase family protein n=1 Tax=Actinomadura gamaensis TaxID=1763541 RepID=A0ABV9TYU4_9ACTN
MHRDNGLTGTKREQPGLDQTLAAVRAGDTLVVPRLGRLAWSVPMPATSAALWSIAASACRWAAASTPQPTP